METVGFAFAAACALLSAIFVVRSSNLIHAVLWLGVTLLTTAGLYAMLGASFLAGVQVLVYVGGVITLMIFGVMITRRHDGLVVQADSGNPARGMFVAGAFFGIVAAAIRLTDGLDVAITPDAVSPADLGRALFREQVLAFEVLSLLLLGAIVGAIVIARRRDPGAPRREPLEMSARTPERAPEIVASEVRP
jgi:NADH-quinone oxidoreductase subunit J